MRPGMSETEKLAYAKQRGVSIRKVYDSDGHLLEEELNSRILEHECARRAQHLWVIALVSACASVVSALAAWAAVLQSKP